MTEVWDSYVTGMGVVWWRCGKKWLRKNIKRCMCEIKERYGRSMGNVWKRHGSPMGEMREIWENWTGTYGSGVEVV